MAKLTLRDLSVRGKRVLVRVDFNVPIEERDGKIVITMTRVFVSRCRQSIGCASKVLKRSDVPFRPPKGKRVEKYSLATDWRLFAQSD